VRLPNFEVICESTAEIQQLRASENKGGTKLESRSRDPTP